MLKPPHVRKRQRLIRQFAGPTLAGLIVGIGAFFIFGPPAQSQPPVACAANDCLRGR